MTVTAFNNQIFNLCQTYKLDLETFYDVLEARPTEDKLTMCALVSAQKCLLCLGDLARYKETIQETCNYGVARQHYQKARIFHNSFSAIFTLKLVSFRRATWTRATAAPSTSWPSSPSKRSASSKPSTTTCDAYRSVHNLLLLLHVLHID